MEDWLSIGLRLWSLAAPSVSWELACLLTESWFGISYLTHRNVDGTFQVTSSRVFTRLQKAPLLVRRFGIIQAIRLLLPELTRDTRLSRFLNRIFPDHVPRLRMTACTAVGCSTSS